MLSLNTSSPLSSHEALLMPASLTSASTTVRTVGVSSASSGGAAETHTEVSGSRTKESTQVHEVAPGESVVSFAGHSEQLSLPTSSLNVPVSQASHVEDAALLVEPAWQDKQVVASTDAFLPGLQGSQEPDPARLCAVS